MANFVYLFWEGREGLVVDPGSEVPRLLADIEAMGVQVTHILVTHGHPDHVQGVEAVKRASGAKIVAHVSADHPVDIPVQGGDVLEIAGIRVAVHHTPGHRYDCACYVIAGTHLVTGDTLFVGECGRVDLPGSDVRAMHHSLLTTLAQLPKDLVVCPGHDYGPKPLSTLGEERRTNYTLKPRSLDEFIAFMAEP
jgi:glyoxylase-like metal-dependent hydrolase (beta-lactamase superfamily II)